MSRCPMCLTLISSDGLCLNDRCEAYRRTLEPVKEDPDWISLLTKLLIDADRRADEAERTAAFYINVLQFYASGNRDDGQRAKEALNHGNGRDRQVR